MHLSLHQRETTSRAFCCHPHAPTTCSYVFFASTSLSTWAQGVNNTARLEFMADDNRIMELTDIQCYYTVSIQPKECLKLPYLDTYINCPGLISYHDISLSVCIGAICSLISMAIATTITLTDCTLHHLLYDKASRETDSFLSYRPWFA